MFFYFLKSFFTLCFSLFTNFSMLDISTSLHTPIYCASAVQIPAVDIADQSSSSKCWEIPSDTELNLLSWICFLGVVF